MHRILSVWLLFISVTSHAYWSPLPDVSANLETNGNQWRVNFTVFDPLLNRWQPTNSGWFLADNVTLRVQPGVVFWEAEINGGSIARFSTYDPNLQAWQTTNSLLLGTTTLGFYGHGGVLYWIENPRRMVAAVYDPVLQRWVTLRGSSIIEGDSIIPVCDQGIVVLYERFDSPQRWYVHCWIFDPLRHEWRTVRLGPYTTSTGLVRIEQGSIRLFIGSQTPLKGYNYISGTWGDGATLPLALFHTSKRDGLAPLGVWFTDLSLGAAQWNWSFGDGSQSTNRSPYHVFQQPGSNSVTLTISGLGGGGSTNALINSYSPPRLQMLGASNGFYQLQLFAQPNSVHLLEQSSNLIDWTLIRWLTNSSGATLIEDAMLSEPSSSFFRSKQISP